jgi:putative hemolysin
MQVEVLQRAARPAGRRLSVGLAATPGEVAEAQQLRHRVFAGEMGARLAAGEPGLDRDRFDDFCDHLLVRDDATGEVLGTYRLLSPEGARRAGGLYSEGEFDLARLAPLRDGLVEAGRSCVHPEHRGGAVIALLWSGIADYMRAGGHRFLAGCASVSLADGGRAAAGVYRSLAATHAAPAQWRVFPRLPLPLDALDPAPEARLPPLVKGYARAGASVCGEPAWDPDFNTADLFMLLPLERLDPRYASRFLAGPAGA